MVSGNCKQYHLKEGEESTQKFGMWFYIFFHYFSFLFHVVEKFCKTRQKSLQCVKTLIYGINCTCHMIRHIDFFMTLTFMENLRHSTDLITLKGLSNLIDMMLLFKNIFFICYVKMHEFLIAIQKWEYHFLRPLQKFLACKILLNVDIFSVWFTTQSLPAFYVYLRRGPAE